MKCRTLSTRSSARHIVAIRNRFGPDGLRKAANLIAIELAIFGDEGNDDADADGIQ